MNAGEEQLVRQCQQGDHAAFASLVAKYRDRVFNLAYRMLGQREDAEDVVQDAFLQTFRAIDRFRPSERFSSWLYRIATNLCIDRLRKSRKKLLSLDGPVSEARDRYEMVDSGSSTPEEEVMARELRRQLAVAVQGLPPDYRAVIVLRHFQGLSYQEIANVLQLPLGTVKTRLFRAREVLRLRLEIAGDRREGAARPRPHC
ncbi:MAG: sigma-70 family RNA polymerase sigma factor [Bacillota bacterium]